MDFVNKILGGMANKNVTMLRIRKLFSLIDRGISQRKACKDVGIGRNIASNYLLKASLSGKSLPELIHLPDEELTCILNEKKPKGDPPELQKHFAGKMPYFVSELDRTGVTRRLLWEEYRKERPDGYGYTQFCEYFNRLNKKQHYSYHNEHHPGEEMQFDFAGDSLYIKDRLTGELKECPVLVCTLPYSSITFVKALPNAKQEHMYTALSECLIYFGGVTKSMKSDNMRQYVKRTDRHEPSFTELAEQWSLYYKTALTAARVAKPKDKANVESHVNIVYTRVHAKLRNETFYTINELNSRIFELVAEHNSKPMQGRSYSRLERFENEEKQFLNPLPEIPFTVKYRKEFTVNASYHVMICPERHFYSIPYRFVGMKAVMVYDTTDVEIYVSHVRVATHCRDYRAEAYTTNEDHMPESHKAYKKYEGQNADYFLWKASLIGASTKEAISQILKSRVFIQHSYNSCRGILFLTKRYEPERIELACKRALSSPSISYSMIKNILERNLESQQETDQMMILPLHDNIRGASSYK